MARNICTVEGCDSFVKGHGYCNRHYQAWWKHGTPTRERRAFTTCQVDDCVKPSRSKFSPYCEMHYGRLRRNGHLDVQLRKIRYTKDRGYVVVWVPEHALANSQELAYEHRVVLFDDIGPGEHPCFWCGETVMWGSTLHVDHLDFVRNNNARSNLVASCRCCNTRRKKDQDPQRWATLIAERMVLVEHAAEVASHRDVLLDRLETAAVDGGFGNKARAGRSS